MHFYIVTNKKETKQKKRKYLLFFSTEMRFSTKNSKTYKIFMQK